MGVNEAIGALKGGILQPYYLDVPGTAAASGLDVVEFRGVEEAGAPTACKITLTHAVADLPRADFLTKTATFSIRPPTLAGVSLPGGSWRRFQGVITQFNQLSSSRDQTTYEVVLESRLALLRNVRRCRFFLNQTFPQIVEQILREHGFGAGTSDFEFTLLRDYEKRALVTQWGETDLQFITRLARRSGMWFVMREGEYGEVVHFGDDFTHYERNAAFAAPYRPSAGLESNGAEAVESFETRTKTIAQSVSVRHYNYNAAPQKIDGEANVAPDDKTTYGTPDVWAAGHLTEDQAEWEAQLRHQALLCEQVVYAGTGNALCVAPGRVFKFTNRTLPDAEYGQFITRVEHSGSRRVAYQNTYTAIPSHLIYRLPLLEEMWPKVQGTVSGRVTSPDRYKLGYINSKGEYQVALDPDRDPRMAGLTSCWMRLAKPFAGAKNTGFHFPLIDGTEVQIAFENGNPDLPFIAHVMHDGVNPDLITSDNRWMSRNAIHTQSNNTVQLEDFPGEEHVKVATEGGGKAQLNLGHMVNSQREKRGEGAELRADEHVSVRGGAGVLLSADTQPRAKGQQLDMSAAQALLEQALAQMQALTDAAKAAQANAAEVEQQKALLEQTLKGLKQAGILVSAPAGMGLVSGDHLQVSAQHNLIATAGGNAEIGVLRKFTVAAGEAVSLFAQKLGIKLFAGKGKVEIQAQGDEMALAALKDITITSTNGKLILTAKDEVWIGAGGSYIKINSNRIENATSGDIYEKCASWSKTSSSSANVAAPSLPQSSLRQCTLRGEQANSDNGALMSGGA
ncbi:type VI secretion system Vgr family protein [Paraburkholderia solisilvae]|uniref:type VI secretion system Vgr family protein n=1 Tax=Paraburkholderia solisilvae TaxID=624376 RepID=UPI001FE76DD7|nr:type VI secretion system Vgr family protein [Paraburkholderia solisilvae]